MAARAVSRLLALRRPLTLGAAALAGLLVLWSGAGTGADEFVAAARQGFRLHPASGEIVIVEIDEKSIAAAGRWPMPRGLHGAMVDRLHQAGAASIAFDVDFSSPSDPRQDALFAAALARAGRSVILPTFRQAGGAGSARDYESAPIPALARNAFLAAANVRPDEDGRLRRMPFGREILGAPRPSFASMVAERPGAAEHYFAIDFSIDPDSIRRYAMADLIAGKVPPEAFAGKRVIVGGTAVELGDRYTVPRHGLLAGVVIQAMAAETLLRGAPPAEGSGFWPLLAALLTLALATRTKRRPLRLGAIGAGAAAVLAMPAAGERLVGLALPLAPALAAFAAAALVGGGALIAARYRERALADAQTGLPNLAALEIDAARSGEIAVAVARIEGFTALLSALGTQAAGELVLRLAERLRFAAGGADVYRIDDAGLAWIEHSGEDLDTRFEAAAAIARAPLSREWQADVRLHFGAASGAGEGARALAANAGLAALQAAERGARWQYFSRDASEEVRRSVALVAEFDAAVAEGRVWNAYQPKLDIRTGRITGVEALVRWNHAERGLLAPDSFVPLLEQHGRAADLTLHVLGNALAEALRWLESGAPLVVAVNVSATLLHDGAATARLQQAWQASGVPAELLIIEVTETAAMADPDAAIAGLESWRALGVGVSIDDYGTGQSSLSYLQKLPATELKIDRSFVESIAAEPRNAIMVRSTIAMAHELRLKVVAEGVGDAECLRLLAQMGCDLAQGYWIARPAAAEAIDRLVWERNGRQARSA